MTKHLYLMRHGETLFNKRRKIQGWCDSPLTKTGILQAKAAKKCLKDISQLKTSLCNYFQCNL